MKVTSKVIKDGDHVDTDVIIPARYLNTADPAELATHCMEDLDTDFKTKAETAKIVVAGRNFGCAGFVRIAYCVSYETIRNSLPGFKRVAESYGL